MGGYSAGVARQLCERAVGRPSWMGPVARCLLAGHASLCGCGMISHNARQGDLRANPKEGVNNMSEAPEHRGASAGPPGARQPLGSDAPRHLTDRGETPVEDELAQIFASTIQQRVGSAVAMATGSSAGSDLVLVDGTYRFGVTEPVDEHSLWDLSSVTKVMVGVSLIGIALDRHALRLDDEISSFHAAYGNRRWRGITVEQVLGHCAGQPAWMPFFEAGLGREAVRRILATGAPQWTPGHEVVYSDLDFLVLWDVLESVFSATIEEAFEKLVAGPLKLAETIFRPLEAGVRARCVATERCVWRDRLLQGEVQDENCASLGGATPHAGLFSSAADLGTFMTEVVRAWSGASDWMSRSTCLRMTGRSGPPAGTFGLGWAKPVDGWGRRGDPAAQPWRFAAAGNVASADSFGHTGFTGASVMADPERDRWVVVLTNRVHPSRNESRWPPIRVRVTDQILRQAPASSPSGSSRASD
jgi:CubicO group peptidase (beta-lactamase class C family)